MSGCGCSSAPTFDKVNDNVVLLRHQLLAIKHNHLLEVSLPAVRSLIRILG